MRFQIFPRVNYYYIVPYPITQNTFTKYKDFHRCTFCHLEWVVVRQNNNWFPAVSRGNTIYQEINYAFSRKYYLSTSILYNRMLSKKHRDMSITLKIVKNMRFFAFLFMMQACYKAANLKFGFSTTKSIWNRRKQPSAILLQKRTY